MTCRVKSWNGTQTNKHKNEQWKRTEKVRIWKTKSDGKASRRIRKT